MHQSIKFWIFMAIFQVIFGLTVFALTRSHYLEQAESTARQPISAHPGTTADPGAMPSSELGQLMDLYSDSPGEVDPRQVLVQADEDFSAGRYQQAAEGYSRLVQSGAADVETYNNLGITLHYLGRSWEALNLLKQGIEMNPGYQRIWLTQGFVASQFGNEELARSSLQRAIEMDPDSDVGQAAAGMLEQLPPS